MLVSQALAGKRVFITGATGFIGEALLRTLLVDLPDARPVVLIRPRAGQDGARRLARVLRKPTFAPAVAAAGGPEALAARVEVVEGDLAEVPELPDDLDVVLHCAGEVSFDPPIDEAFAANVVGTLALLERVRAVDDAQRRRGRRVHYVHVSTAYVSGRRRGPVAEAALDHAVDWRTELDAATALAARLEEASRAPDRLAVFNAAADAEHGPAGALTSAADAERRRREWVVKAGKDAGRERGHSLGWTDVYTFTKAMGERVVEGFAADVGLPVTILRPSIVESALLSPYPGWIEGFKMAEPLLLSLGRGELPEVPAAPDASIDIVPVDHVVNALVAVAASPPAPADGVRYLHVSSGARNPLTFRRVYELAREHFEHHPFDPGESGPDQLPTWTFPGAAAAERRLATGERAHALAERALRLVPRSETVRRWARDLDRGKDRLELLRRYSDLYLPYTRSELHFVDDATLALHRSLEPADAQRFGFDTAVIDWEHYIRDVHVPAVSAPVRRQDELRRRRRARSGARRELAPAPDGDVLAVFDLDGTLMASNVIEGYLWVRLPELSRAQRVGEVAAMLASLPSLLAADRRDRGDFLRQVYRRYDGADPEQLDALVDEVVTPHVLARMSAPALRRVRAHRAAGHRTVLLTGAIRPLTRPFAPLFDEIVAADLAIGEDGLANGYLATPPLVGEARAAWVVRHAAVGGFDLTRSYAYADSHSDLPLLRCVGLPTAVSPDVPLMRAARGLSWPVETWGAPRDAGASGGLLRRLVPTRAGDSTGVALP